MKLSNKMYDVLKWLCLIAMPAAAWGYSELAGIWQLPYGAEIPKTINIVAFVIGCLIGVSTLNYNAEAYNIDGAGYEHAEDIVDDGEPAPEEFWEEEEEVDFLEPKEPELPEEVTE